MNNQSPGSRLASFENAVSVAVMGAMVALPLTEFLGGLTIGRGIVTGSGPLVQHLMLWVAFLGAALAARSDSLLALSTPDLLPAGWRAPIRIFASAVGAGITVWLLISSVTLVRAFSTFDDRLALGIPRWIAFLALPAGFALIAARLILNASENRAGRFAAAGGLAFPLLFLLALTPGDSPWVAPALLVILAATVLGMPVYAALGGAALVLFWQDLSPLVEVSYDILDVTNSPQLPAIPLFTVAGYLLAEGGAGRRLLAMFSAWLGWMPGGLAIAVTLILALFTPLTGASGVTILSLGGLLLPMMARAGYPRDTSLGLVTVSGSIGLLLPPSLPVILYAVHGTGEGRVVRIDHLFIGALVPGLLLILVVAAWAAFRGWKTEVPRTAFEPARAVRSIIEAKWELLLPVILVGGYFGGFFASLVEAAAVTAVYAFVVECLVCRDLGLRRDIPRIAVESASLVGSFFVILGSALAFNHYLINMQVPDLAVAWIQEQIASPIVFLLALNVLLVLVGALMDIYSAIFIIAPLIAPMGAAYGIDPVHLGVIFLANMELGYLMPPMGENLFLSAMRFERPLTEVYRSTLPYVAILAATVLLITFVPELTLWMVATFGG